MKFSSLILPVKVFDSIQEMVYDIGSVMSSLIELRHDSPKQNLQRITNQVKWLVANIEKLTAIKEELESVQIESLGCNPYFHLILIVHLILMVLLDDMKYGEERV